MRSPSRRLVHKDRPVGLPPVRLQHCSDRAASPRLPTPAPPPSRPPRTVPPHGAHPLPSEAGRVLAAGPSAPVSLLGQRLRTPPARKPQRQPQSASAGFRGAYEPPSEQKGASREHAGTIVAAKPTPCNHFSGRGPGGGWVALVGSGCQRQRGAVHVPGRVAELDFLRWKSFHVENFLDGHGARPPGRVAAACPLPVFLSFRVGLALWALIFPDRTPLTGPSLETTGTDTWARC